MTFHSARCECCRRYVFKVEDVGVAYGLVHRWPPPEDRNTVPLSPKAIDLEGQEPWQGVYVMCRACLEFFKALPGQRLTSDAE